MAQRKSPAAARRQGFDNGKAVQAISFIEATAPRADLQERLAVHRLVARFRLLPATAALVVELAGMEARS